VYRNLLSAGVSRLISLSSELDVGCPSSHPDLFSSELGHERVHVTAAAAAASPGSTAAASPGSAATAGSLDSAVWGRLWLARLWLRPRQSTPAPAFFGRFLLRCLTTSSSSPSSSSPLPSTTTTTELIHERVNVTATAAATTAVPDGTPVAPLGPGQHHSRPGPLGRELHTPRRRLQPGAYTRPLFSSTLAPLVGYAG